jgi:phage gp45-like
MPTAADNMNYRGKIAKTYDDKDQQVLELTARHGERMGGNTGAHGVPRVQNYGMTSHLPAESHLHTLVPEGNPDKATVIGGEHAPSRPKNLAEGEVKFYCKFGQYMFFKADGSCEIFADGCKITMKSNKITLEATTIVTKGETHLGTEGGVPASMEGTIDTDGDVEVANLATKVFVT